MVEFIKEIAKNPILILPGVVALVGYAMILAGFWEYAIFRAQRRLDKVIDEQRKKFLAGLEEIFSKHFTRDPKP